MNSSAGMDKIQFRQLIPDIPIGSNPFQLVDVVQKWKYVHQRRKFTILDDLRP